MGTLCSYNAKNKILKGKTQDPSKYQPLFFVSLKNILIFRKVACDYLVRVCPIYQIK